MRKCVGEIKARRHTREGLSPQRGTWGVCGRDSASGRPLGALCLLDDSFQDTQNSGPCWAELRVPLTHVCVTLEWRLPAQQPPGPCLPASRPLPPAAVPAGSEGQLAPGAASQARPLTSAPKSPLVRPWPGTVAPSPRATDAMWTALGLTPACVGAVGASMAPAEPRCPLGPLLFP